MQRLIRVLLLLGLLSCLEARRLECQKSNMECYDCMVSPNESYTIHWELEHNELCLKIEARTHGWVGICFPQTPGKMLPADSVMGWVDEDGPNVNAYNLTDFNVTSEDVHPRIKLRKTKGSETKGCTHIEFCLNLDELTYRFDSQNVTYINWAFGYEDGLTNHGENLGSATIRFADKPDDDAPPPSSRTRAGAYRHG